MLKAIEQYKIFKKLSIVDNSTAKYKGKGSHLFFYLKVHTIWIYYKIFTDYDSKLKLRFVRIYFDVTTFDRVTQDSAAKFVDMLSAIGGTMGLLTGFSIISGVEIVYFGIKIILNILRKRLDKKN